MKGFFEQLAEICEGLTVNLSISMKDGLMTVSMVPMITNKVIHPMTVSNANPKELDEQFVIELLNGIRVNKAKITGLAEMQKSLNEKPKTQVEKNKIETKGTPENKAVSTPKPIEKLKIEHQPGLDL